MFAIKSEWNLVILGTRTNPYGLLHMGTPSGVGAFIMASLDIVKNLLLRTTSLLRICYSTNSEVWDIDGILCLVHVLPSRMVLVVKYPWSILL